MRKFLINRKRFTEKDLDDTAYAFNKQLVYKLEDLRSAISEYNEYQNYDKNLAVADENLAIAKKAYNKLKTTKRFEKYLKAELKRAALISKHKNADINKLEELLKSFESFLDRKYWDEKFIISLIIELSFGNSYSVEEAIKAVQEK